MEPDSEAELQDPPSRSKTMVSAKRDILSRLLPDTMHVVAAADGAVTYFQTESRHRKNKQDVGGQIDSGKAVNHPKREHHHSKFRAYNTLLSLLAS